LSGHTGVGASPASNTALGYFLLQSEPHECEEDRLTEKKATKSLTDVDWKQGK
jgi:hypothetical protein